MDTATIRSGYANYWHDEKAKVWDEAYQQGAYDTLLSPAEATENPYR
jgi:hypothetical protein